MNIDIERRSGITVLSLDGELTGGGESPLPDVVNARLGSGIPRLVIDMSRVAFMSSDGLGELVRVATQINTLEGRVVLAAALPFVEGVFHATQLDRFFEICGTVDDAVALLEDHSDAALA